MPISIKRPLQACCKEINARAFIRENTVCPPSFSLSLPSPSLFLPSSLLLSLSSSLLPLLPPLQIFPSTLDQADMHGESNYNIMFGKSAPPQTMPLKLHPLQDPTFVAR